MAEKNQEIWKPIPGFNGYFVSNQGRVRTAKLQKKILKTQKKNGYLWVGLIDNEGKERLRSVHQLMAQAFIPNPENKPEIDHINTIRDDNRLENLRWVTSKENSQNELTLDKKRLLKGEKSPKFGYKTSEETKAKLRAAHLGKRVSDETKAKISQALKGEKNYLYGKHLKTETKQKLSEGMKGRFCSSNNPHAKKVAQYTREGVLIKVWDCMSDAAREIGGNIGTIVTCAKGRSKTAYNYIWKYL